MNAASAWQTAANSSGLAMSDNPPETWTHVFHPVSLVALVAGCRNPPDRHESTLGYIGQTSVRSMSFGRKHALWLQDDAIAFVVCRVDRVLEPSQHCAATRHTVARPHLSRNRPARHVFAKAKQASRADPRQARWRLESSRNRPTLCSSKMGQDLCSYLFRPLRLSVVRNVPDGLSQIFGKAAPAHTADTWLCRNGSTWTCQLRCPERAGEPCC